MKRLFSAFLLLMATQICFGQGWILLENAPVAPWRHDDVFFLDKNLGWVVNVDGNIHKTTDGGETWSNLVEDSNTSFRCVGFANPSLGWVGNLGPGRWAATNDTVPLYQTNDGGETWLPVENITGERPDVFNGVCGLHVVNDSVVYAVGRVAGPAYMLKTTDAGENWTSIDLTETMNGIIDCYFFDSDRGVIIGNTPSSNFFQGKAIILYTEDGGQNWETKYISDRKGTLGWKICFPTDSIGYVSTESGANDSVFVMKTIDKGVTWSEHLVVGSDTWFQGIGFIDENTGWVGADETYTTTDGGMTWDTTSFVLNFNRFRQVNETVAYAVGKEVWKYTDSTKVVTSINNLDKPTYNILGQNYPNPFLQTTTIPYYVPEKSQVTLRVYDFAGRHILTLVDQIQEKGEYETTFESKYAGDEMFFYSLSIGNQSVTKSMILTTKE